MNDDTNFHRISKLTHGANDDTTSTGAQKSTESFSDQPDAEETPEAQKPGLVPPGDALEQAYKNITEFGSSPKVVLDVMDKETKDAVDAYLYGFYEAGTKAKQIGRAVLKGFANGQFATESERAFALVAFLTGTDIEGKFNLVDIFRSVKK